MALQWTDELSIGIDEVDRENREILGKYNDFIILCRQGKGREFIPHLISSLVSYVENHFASEEEAMVDARYPDFKNHIEEHRNFSQVIQGLKQKLAEEGPTIGLIADVNLSVLNWFVDHVKKADLQFGGFLNQRWGFF